MTTRLHRREWLKQSSLAAFGLGLSLNSLGNEEGLTRNFGKDKGLINLGANENPYGISPKAKQAIVDMMEQANRYQFNVSSLQSFRKQLAEKFDVRAENILPTAGSGEALALLARYFSKGNTMVGNPTFGILPGTARRLGHKVIEVPLTQEKVHDLPAMLSTIDSNTQLVYIVNPANPTGTILRSSDLKDFCIEASKKAVVLIDEAYIDFIKPPNNVSMIALIENNPNVLVTRTFSKVHGMAGLRLGFTVGNSSLINKLEQNYFSIVHTCLSNLSMAAALASLNDTTHALQSIQKNEAARQFAFNELIKLNYRCIPSSTNFLFFQLKNYSGDFAQDMLRKNILLRSNNYDDGKWCRVSIGTMEEMQEFINVMKQSA